MWIFDFIPNFLLSSAANIAIVLGLVGVALMQWQSNKPNSVWSLQQVCIQVISIILLLSGVFIKGIIIGETSLREQLEQAEHRIKLAEDQSQQVNQQLSVEYKDKIKVVKEKFIVYQDKIAEVKQQINKDCIVPSLVIDIHNEAAQNLTTESLK